VEYQTSKANKSLIRESFDKAQWTPIDRWMMTVCNNDLHKAFFNETMKRWKEGKVCVEVNLHAANIELFCFFSKQYFPIKVSCIFLSFEDRVIGFGKKDFRLLWNLKEVGQYR